MWPEKVINEHISVYACKGVASYRGLYKVCTQAVDSSPHHRDTPQHRVQAHTTHVYLKLELYMQLA